MEQLEERINNQIYGVKGFATHLDLSIEVK